MVLSGAVAKYIVITVLFIYIDVCTYISQTDNVLVYTYINTQIHL